MMSKIPRTFDIYSTEIGGVNFSVTADERMGLELTFTMLDTEYYWPSGKSELLHCSVLPNEKDEDKLYLTRYHTEPRFDLSFFSPDDFKALKLEFGINVYDFFGYAIRGSVVGNQICNTKCIFEIESWAIKNKRIAEQCPASSSIHTNILSFLSRLNSSVNDC